MRGDRHSPAACPLLGGAVGLLPGEGGVWAQLKE